MGEHEPLVVTVVAGPGDRPDMSSAPADAEVRYAGCGELGAVLPGTEVVFMWDFTSPCLRDAFAAGDGLRWVHTASTGTDTLMFPELIASDVVVTNSGHVFADAIAEYVLGLILAFRKDLLVTWQLQQARRWQHRDTHRLQGTRVLIVGAGAIGRATGRLLRATGCEVLGVARTSREHDPDLGRIISRATMRDTMPWADFVVLAVPLTPETTHLIDSDLLARAGPSSCLINVGRGRLVDTDALVDALSHARLAGAALDVFEDEPLPPEHPLWTMDHVIVSPHMSGDYVGVGRRLVEIFLDNLGRYQRGEPLCNVVNKCRGY